MACVVYTGGYEQTGEALRALHGWTEANGWAAAGAPREVYVRFGASSADELRLPKAFLTDRRDRYVTEIQLPVAPQQPSGKD
jgi:effector-binding domain-containing protein